MPVPMNCYMAKGESLGAMSSLLPPETNAFNTGKVGKLFGFCTGGSSDGLHVLGTSDVFPTAD